MRRALQRHRLLALPRDERRDLLLPCQLAQTLCTSPRNSAEAEHVTTGGSGSADGGGADIRFLQRKHILLKPEQEHIATDVTLIRYVPALRCSTVAAVCANGCGRGAATAAAGGPACCSAAASHAASSSTAGEMFACSGGSMGGMCGPWWERAPLRSVRSVVVNRPHEALGPSTGLAPTDRGTARPQPSNQPASATKLLCTCRTLTPVAC